VFSDKPLKNDYEAWKNCPPEDLWVFDKLVVSRKCGYICGPRGLPVPKPDQYIIRPVSNLEGMGQGAYIDRLENGTKHIPHGFFWNELFTGLHISVDYTDTKPVLSVLGIRDLERPLQRFTHWKMASGEVPLPPILYGLTLRHRFINCEFIGGKLIEVHLRHNPDFAYGNTEMIPVWPGQSTEPPAGFRFIADTDEEDRVGIFVN